MSSPFNLSPWFTIALTRISSVFEELIYTFVNHRNAKQGMKINPPVVQEMGLQKLQEILMGNMIITKEMILTQRYAIPLNAFQIFGFSKYSVIPYI